MESLPKVELILPNQGTYGAARIKIVLGSSLQSLIVELKADFEGSSIADLKALALERLIQDLRAAADDIEEGVRQVRR